MNEGKRIIDAEVVRSESTQTQRVQVARERGQSRAWLRQRGTLEISDAALRRVRWRFGVAALIALFGAAGLVWLAATTEYAMLAALFILVALVIGLAGLVFAALWRLIGRLGAQGNP